MDVTNVPPFWKCTWLIIFHAWLVPRACSGLTFALEPSVKDVHTPDGKLDVLTVTSSTHCMTECYMNPYCVSVGFVGSSVCQRYSTDVTDYKEGVISQADTVFYKSVCSRTDYTYVRWLGLCIKRHDSAPNTYDKATKTCASEGASLLEMDTIDKRQFFMDVLFHVHSSDFQYVLGGHMNGTDWTWDLAGLITISNGGLYWNEGEPTNNIGHCLALKSISTELVLTEIDCTALYPFICSYTN